jgi:DNA-directed RNA polymerase specialized sigma24 family protein
MLAVKLRAYKQKAVCTLVTQELLREEPKLTQFAFHRLLAWLDDGADSRGESYIEMRRRLVAYFDRRNRPFADDLADQTFNRISKTLEQSGSIAVRPPARYCYVVARFVLLEDIRRSRRYVQVDETRDTLPFGPRPVMATDDRASVQEQRLECLDRCLHQLSQSSASSPSSTTGTPNGNGSTAVAPLRSGSASR